MKTIQKLLPRDLLLQIIEISFAHYKEIGEDATVNDHYFLKEYRLLCFLYLTKFTLHTKAEVELFKEITKKFDPAMMDTLKQKKQYNYYKLRFK